ncbi:MAG: TolC family protein, partial [Muribaculaceae bacterium]|nr:TolC family protein [Muribaculaceae bacterium]
ESCDYMFQLCRSDSLRYLSGEITEIEYRQSRLEAVTLLNEVCDQDAAYHSALVDLNMFIGESADTLNIPEGNWDGLKRDFSLAGLLETGMRENPQLMAAAKNVEVCSKAYRLERVGRRPDIGLSLSYERDWQGFRPRIQYAKVGVSIPLPFSNTNKGALRSAEYRIEQASVMEREAGLRVQSGITQAWYSFEAQRKKVARYQSGVLDDARKVLDGTVYMYQRGETGILDVLIAQRSYNQTHQDYLETMKGYVSALVSLEKACGIWDIRF